MFEEPLDFWGTSTHRPNFLCNLIFKLFWAKILFQLFAETLSFPRNTSKDALLYKWIDLASLCAMENVWPKETI